ncbi:hypothetical protein ACV2OC_000585 [Campylobacter jejuni]
MLEILITLIIAFILALIFGNYLYKIASCKKTICRRKNKISIWKNKTSIKVEILFFYKP